MAKASGKVHIGTSGWHYTHWKGAFYPHDLPVKKFLSFYAETFSTVEINRTFYGLPKKQSLSEYDKMVPKAFIFSVKASRFITHTKRLKVPKSSLNKFFSCVNGLGSHLGPVLFQLPPRWNLNLERLESFLNALPQGYRYAFEFRDPRWFEEEVYVLLKKHKAAFCIYEFEGIKAPWVITSNFVYVRLHGPKKKAYTGKYSLPMIRKWADFFSEQAKEGRDIYCYFDNDEEGFAALNAKSMNRMVHGPKNSKHKRGD